MNQSRRPADSAESQYGRALLGLREMVIRGEFHPGERLTGVALGHRLGVSRTPVRLALERLVQEGLLEPAGANGFSVREFTLRDVWDAIEARGVLEGAAARLAAERLSSLHELDAITKINDQLAGFSIAAHLPSTEEMLRYAELNGAFHAALLDLAKSPMLKWSLERIQSIPFASPAAVILPKAAEGAVIAQAQHRAILDSIANREGARAENVAKEHARFARQHLELALAESKGSSLRKAMGLALVKRDAASEGELP